MSMNYAKRTTAVLLALLLTGGTLLSCSESETNADETKGSETVQISAADETEPEEISITEEVRAKYKDIDYGDATIRIAGFESGTFFYSQVAADFNEILYEEQTGDIYKDAVFERNVNTEELLGVKIEAEFLPYTDGFQTVANALAKYVLSGDPSVDMGIGSLSENIVAAASNNLYNLNDIDTIETDERWFDQNIVRNYSYRNKYLYAITGAHTIFDDYSVPTIYYDKTIMTLNQLEDPADLVMEGKWTIDAMMTMAETVTADTNGDGVMASDADTFGIFDNTDMLPHFMEGTGNLKTKIGDDGIPYLNCLTTEYIDTAEVIYNRIITSPATVIGPVDGVTTAFGNGYALFAYELLATINRYRDRESDFSVLPLPKKDETQENYVSPVNSVWCTSFAIPVSVTETERAGCVINVLNAMSMDTVNSVLYEQILGGKLIREQKSLVMLDFILNNKQYCWANGYSWAGSVSGYCTGYEQNGTFVLASQARKMSKLINATMDIFLAKFDEINGIIE